MSATAERQFSVIRARVPRELVDQFARVAESQERTLSSELRYVMKERVTAVRIPGASDLAESA